MAWPREPETEAGWPLEEPSQDYPDPRLASSHHGHGGTSDGESPDDPDCSCRATEFQPVCAEAGCGFCRAAERAEHVCGN